MDAGEPSRWRGRVGLLARRSPSWQAGGEGAQPAGAVGVGELAVDEADALLARLDRAVAQHQMREIDVPVVRRHVGALGHEAHVAERAGLLDLGVVLLLHAVDLAGRAVVDQVEQPREGIAQVEAAPAAVADVEDPLHLRFERLFVPEPRVLPIQGVAGGGFEAAFAHVDAVSLEVAGRKRGPVRVPFARPEGLRPSCRVPSGSGRRGSSRPWPASRTSRRFRRSLPRAPCAPCPDTCRCIRASRRRSRP